MSRLTHHARSEQHMSTTNLPTIREYYPMHEIHSQIDGLRESADKRYEQLVIDALSTDSLPPEAKLRSILVDAGKSLSDFEADVARGRNRSAALAQLSEVHDEQTRTQIIVAELNEKRAALQAVRERHKEELRLATSELNHANATYSSHLGLIERLRREAMRVLEATCCPMQLRALQPLVQEIQRVSSELSVARVAAQPGISDPRPEVEAKRLQNIEIAKGKVQQLTVQLAQLNDRRAEIESQIYAEYPGIPAH